MATAVVGSEKKIFRTAEPLVETYVLEARADPMDLVQVVRDHWTTLRAKNLAAATPVQVLLSRDNGTPKVVYVFSWRDADARDAAQDDAAIQSLLEQIEELGAPTAELVSVNECYQGFDHQKFPDYGGIELLKGRCDCRVELDNGETSFMLAGQNGFVLMHRSPGGDVDGDGNREMYVAIIDHGADCVEMPEARHALESMVGSRYLEGPSLDNIRVGQNKSLPQYGLIRAQSPDSDFPATAMWVVHWRIWTGLGTLVTDPNTPLVFGPTTVAHYPPVGKEFHASTGPVDLIHEATGEVVGKLIPGQLTAFDIVVTKDDEVDSPYFNAADSTLIEIFNERTAAV
jgi:quinol monooxygenase YgiN